MAVNFSSLQRPKATKKVFTSEAECDRGSNRGSNSRDKGEGGMVGEKVFWVVGWPQLTPKIPRDDVRNNNYSETSEKFPMEDIHDA